MTENHLENAIKDVVNQKMNDGTVERLVSNHLEKGVEGALDDLFGYCGDLKKIIEDQIRSVMIPFLENHDYSKYVVKLDSVLVEVLKAATSENRKMLRNFKELIMVDEEDDITVTELFGAWKRYVAREIDTSNLRIDYKNDYFPVNVSLKVEDDASRSWSSFKYKTLIFECAEDEKMNMFVKLYRYRQDGEWTVDYKTVHDITSLRRLNKMDILLMRLSQNRTKIVINTRLQEDIVEPDTEPEASFS